MDIMVKIPLSMINLKSNINKWMNKIYIKAVNTMLRSNMQGLAILMKNSKSPIITI